MTWKENVINNTPASGWPLATTKEKRLLGKSTKQPYFVRTAAKQVRKGSPVLTRDAYTKKAFGMHRRKLAEVRATEEGAAHPVHGYKRKITGRLGELLRKRRQRKIEKRRLELVRKARAAFERDGAKIAARVQAERVATATTARVKRNREATPWTGFEGQLDQAIGPNTASAVASRELPHDGRITDGQWHGLIDALKDQVGENSPLVKLLRSSGRYWEGGVWVTD